MRAAPILFVPLLLLAACDKEPDFDARYEKAAKEIEARAKAMDTDIAKSEVGEVNGATAAPEDLPPPAKPSNAAPSSGE